MPMGSLESVCDNLLSVFCSAAGYFKLIHGFLYKSFKFCKKLHQVVQKMWRFQLGGVLPSNSKSFRFHSAHDTAGARVTRNGKKADLDPWSGRTLVFSGHAVQPNEKISLRLVARDYENFVQFGFTNNDPAVMQQRILSRTYGPLTTEAGFWKINVRSVSPQSKLDFMVNRDGTIHYRLNGSLGKVATELETDKGLWAFVRFGRSVVTVSTISKWETVTAFSTAVQNAASALLRPFGHRCSSSGYYPRVDGLLKFHRTTGQNAFTSDDGLSATRYGFQPNNGYVFLAAPIQSGQKFVIKLVRHAPTGCLSFGITSCDPSTLNSMILPDDSKQLFRRPEIWLLKDNVAGFAADMDEICFTIAQTGEVLISKNGGAAIPLDFPKIDFRLPMWAFFDMKGTTKVIHLLGNVPRRISNVHGCGNVPIVAGMSPPRVAIENNTRDQQTTSVLSRIRNALEAMTEAVSPPVRQLRPNYDSAVTNTDPECIFCKENPSNCALYPCGHLCFCADCATQYANSRDLQHCPICRSAITDTIRIYRS